MIIVNGSPEKDLETLWRIQEILLGTAEQVLGPRDHSKTIGRPEFHTNGPRIYNTDSPDGAHVVLSSNAKNFWPTAIYEMAHETVHLLNPVRGYTTWLEEGMAVEFSIIAQQKFGITDVQTPGPGPYFDALTLVKELPNGALSAGKLIRNTWGPMSTVSYETLVNIFPLHNTDKLKKLSETFNQN